MLEEAFLQAIAEKVVGYAWDKIGERIRRKLGRDAVSVAFKRALTRAYEKFKHSPNKKQYPSWIVDVFDPDFFEHEGKPILAQFLLRGSSPHPSQLAECWVNTLMIRNSARHAALIRELEPAAADFLDYLARELKNEPQLKELNDRRVFEQLAQDIAAIRHKLDAELSTYGMYQDYLYWLMGQNLYIDSRGISHTQLQVQVKLDKVYVSLRALRETTPGEMDRRILEQELIELQAKDDNSDFSSEEIEDQHELFLAQIKQELNTDVKSKEKILDLAETVNLHDRLVILGDPGSGKTTLLRFLALRHAQALWRGRTEIDSELGEVHFPILIRIAEYVEHALPVGKSIRDFLVDYCSMHECPRSGLADLMETELSKGNCLLLLDGFDEVNANQRQVVVGRIQDFVNRRENKANRIIITSRIAGYRKNQLGSSFAHYTLQEMTDTQIQRFLENWCPAVEFAQTPEMPANLRDAVAHREIDGIMKAIHTWPGVHRLATNPLLLKSIALVHRSNSQIPERRIELYKTAATTLAQSWRAAKGEREEPLLKDHYLTPLLSKLAYWLHLNKPGGIATESEIRQVLSEEWARINRLHLDVDDPSPAIGLSIDNFLVRVREHTGLLVEKAPQRYGFMHLTFEEYYAARYLVKLSKPRVHLLRKHLHDARWDEPILLALAFVSIDSAEEASNLLETAILADGEDANDLDIFPSPYEEFLGRDFLFALKCLGENIPAPQKVLRRLASELLDNTGSAKFYQYRRALKDRLRGLRQSEAASYLRKKLENALDNSDQSVRFRATQALGELGEKSQGVLVRLLRALHDDYIRDAAVWSLGELGLVTPEVVDELINFLRDRPPPMRSIVTDTLIRLGQTSPKVAAALIDALQDWFPPVRDAAAEALKQLGKGSPEVILLLINYLNNNDKEVVSIVVKSLSTAEQAIPDVMKGLLLKLHDSDSHVRASAVWSLGELKQVSREIIMAITDALQDDDENLSVREEAARSLGKLDGEYQEVTQALIQALQQTNPFLQAAAAQSLGELHVASAEVITALLNVLVDAATNGPEVSEAVVKSLGELRQPKPEVIEALLKSLFSYGSNWEKVRIAAAKSLGRLNQRSPDVIDALINRTLRDQDHYVRRAAMEQLIQLGQPRVVTKLLTPLRKADTPVRSLIAGSLGELEQDQASPAIIEALLMALQDNEALVRLEAAKSLIELGQKDTFSRVITVLFEALKYPDRWYRQRAAFLLGLVGTSDEPCIQALWRGLQDRDIETRSICAHSLAKLGQRFPDKRHAIAELLVETIKNNASTFLTHSIQDYAFNALWFMEIGEAIEIM